MKIYILVNLVDKKDLLVSLFTKFINTKTSLFDNKRKINRLIIRNYINIDKGIIRGMVHVKDNSTAVS